MTENFNKHAAQCMICDKTITAQAPKNIDFPSLCMIISTLYNWQTTLRKEGAFLCCQQCINIAYEENGRLGFLKEEYFERMRK